MNTSNKTTKIIDYKGKTIVCDCYKYSDGNSTITCTIDPKTKVSYEYTYSDGTEAWSIALKDTNLDVSLKQNEQEVVSGSFVLYDYSFHLTSALVLKGEAEYKMSEYDPNTDLGKMDYHVNVGIHEAVKATITQITPSGEIVTDISNKPETKDNFLGDVLFDSFVGSLEGWGYVVTYGDKSTDTIDTLYGKRHITIQTLDAYLPDKDATFVYTLVYGDKGMIYSREMSAEYGDAEKITKRCTWNYEGSSLKI